MPQTAKPMWIRDGTTQNIFRGLLHSLEEWFSQIFIKQNKPRITVRQAFQECDLKNFFYLMQAKVQRPYRDKTKTTESKLNVKVCPVMYFRLLIKIFKLLLAFLLNYTTEPFVLLLNSRGADSIIVLDFIHSSAATEHHHMPYKCCNYAGIHNVILNVFGMLLWRRG